MKLTIRIESKTVRGTDRGGEDLFFVVKATTGKEEPTREALEAALPGATEALLASLPTGLEAADEAEAPYWLDGDTVRSTFESDYEFRVDWTTEKVRETVRQAVLGDGWKKALSTGKHSVKAKIFVDGNAD